MKTRISILLPCCAALLAAGLFAQPASAQQSRPNLVETARQAGNFTTLLAAVEAAGLAETLAGPGPWTVLAPTDEAFEAIDQQTLSALLEPENRQRLIGILKYHVVPGRVLAADVVSLDSAETAGGVQVDIRTEGDRVFVGGARVVQADIEASNGVIHVIDKVLMPPTIADIARSDERFSTLLAAVEAAGLTDVLAGDGPITVFAPTNEAFDNLPDGLVEQLLQPANRPQLRQVLRYHVVAGRQMLGRRMFETVEGSKVNVVAVGAIMVNNAQITQPDVVAANGVIHVIDTVLLPGQAQQPPAARQARELIELAIDRGVPLFNAGQAEACAAIYEVAAASLIEMDGHGMTPAEMQRLRRALTRSREIHDSHRRAWMLRHALDRAYMAMR